MFFFFIATATTEIYTTDTRFPYTTLFRSAVGVRAVQALGRAVAALAAERAGVRQDEPGLGELVDRVDLRSEEHTSELQSLMRTSYAVFCLKKKKNHTQYYMIEHNENLTQSTYEP